jgi:hypothetical protein
MLAQVESQVLSPLGRAGVRLRMPPASIPAPGQAVLACRPVGDNPVRQMLLPFALHADGFSALAPEEAAWQPGEGIDLLGPIGRPFRPPAARRRWLLAALGADPEVLLPMLNLGIERGVSLALFADSDLPTLPPQVEISTDLDAALDWADYAALAVTAEWFDLRGLASPALQAAHGRRLAEVLVLLAMPCGTGVCGACAVGHGRTSRCACTEGPVFALEDLMR